MRTFEQIHFFSQAFLCFKHVGYPGGFLVYYQTEQFLLSNQTQQWVRAGAVVRALASNWFDPGSILTSDHMWVKFVIGSFSSPRGFPPGTPVFPSPQKPALLNSNSTRNARMHNTWASGSGDWVTTPRIIELKITWFDFDFWFGKFSGLGIWSHLPNLSSSL